MVRINMIMRIGSISMAGLLYVLCECSREHEHEHEHEADER